MKNKIKEIIQEKKTPKPFDEEHIIHPLKMFVIIVPYGQANGVIKMLNSMDSAMNFITNGEGTYQRESQLNGPKKQIIFTILRDDKVEEFKQKMSERFKTSQSAKGIAFSIKLTSVAGVSVYKFLSNSRKVEKR